MMIVAVPAIADGFKRGRRGPPRMNTWTCPGVGSIVSSWAREEEAGARERGTCQVNANPGATPPAAFPKRFSNPDAT